MPAHPHIRTSLGGAEVVEAYAPGRTNRRILTGIADQEGPWTVGSDGIRRRLLRFAPGGRFALDYWERNEYGTTRWRVAICEAQVAGTAVTPMPAIRPGVALLVDVQGAARVRAFLAWLAEQGNQIDRFSRAELARIELHFQRMSLARLRALQGSKKQ